MDPSVASPRRPSFFNYLLGLDRQYQYHLDDRVKEEILATCNRYLFSDDPLFLDLVGRPTEEPRRRLVVPPLYRDTADVYYPSSDEEGADGDDGPLGIEYSESRRGKPCGHVFFRGEGVYRCRNCSLDDTCVLCARCFQASDHTGHDTSFSVNSGTGGCCDCGDREAWDASVKCRYHSCEDGETPREAVELPTHAVAGFASTIKVALEFMLATFCLSPDPFKAVLDKESIVRDAYRASVPYAERPELNVYTTVLWNDDGHSFQEVTDQLTECLGISLERARAITDQTHVVGRSVILTSPDLATHLRVARHLSSIRLQVSIRSARDTFREQLCALLLGWLKDLSKVSSEKYQALNLHFEGTFNSTIKNCLCTLLTKPWELVGRNARLRNALLDDNAELTEIPVDPVACVSPEETLDPRELVWDGVPAASIPNCPVPVLNPNQWDPTGFTPATPVPLTPAAGSDSEGDPPSSPSVADDADLDAEDAVTDVSAPTTGNLFAHRLDWFLVYDMRLWHEVRTGLRELYMATLTLSTRHKRGIAASFATNYDRLSSSFLLRDKGPEHSIILFSVQLFTVPSIARTLTMRNGFLYTIIRILRQFFVKDTPPELLARGVISCDSQAFRNRRYFHVFHDMRYLTGTKTCVRAMRDDTQFLDLYLRFLRLFQGMDPIVRQMGNHVEYETDTWINAFNVTLQVAKSCRLLANCYFRRPRAFAHALRACLRLILHTALKGGEESGGTNLPEYPVDPTPYFRSITLRWGATYPVLSYSVSSGYVSFHHPLHWFLAQLLHRRQRLRRSALRAGGWDDFLALVWTFNCPGWDNGRPLGGDPDLVARLRRDPAQQRRLLLIFDYPIRVCCLMAQIRAYLWVRNGHLAKSSAAHYCEITLRNNTFDLDVFLIQTAFCLLEPDHILLTMLDRYEILDFFHGRAGPHPNYEPSHILQMVEQFLHLLIVCVSERAVPANLPTAEHTRRFIVHGTVTPVPYTDLMKQVPDRLTEATSYDQLIRTVTDFRTPAFSNDVGNYELKDEYVSDVDPYFAHYPRNRKVEAETRLRAHARAHAPPGTRHPDFFHTNLVRLPSGPYQSLGNLLHGPLACQIMFYAVHASAHGAGSTVYGNLLDYGIHLIYLAVRDTNNDYYQPEWGPDPTQATDAADGHPLSPGTGGIWVHAGALKFPLGPAALMEDGTGPHMTLLDLVLQCLTRAECQVWAGKLEFIVHQFRRCGSPAVRETVRHHLHYQLERNMQAKAAAEETERQAQEAKRQLARQKRQQMMASLVSAQQQFIANHSQLYEDLDPEAEVEGEASEGRRSRVEVTGPGADPHYEEQQGNYPKDEGEDEDESDDDDDDDDDDDEDQASVGTGNPDAPADERNHDNEEGEEEEDRDYTDGEDDEDYAYDEVEDEEDDRYVGHASGLHSDLGDPRGGDEHTYEDADRQGLSLSVTSADMINALIETSRARPSSHRLPIAQLVDDDVDRVYSSQPYHPHHHHRRRRSGPVFTASHTLGAADPYAFAYPIPEYQCAPLLNPRRRRPRQYDLAPLVTPPALEAESKSTQAPLKRRGAASTRRRRVERAASPDRSRAYHRLVRIFALNGRRSLRAARNAATALQRVTQFRQCARFSPRRRRRPDPIDLLPQPLPPGVEHPHRVDREPPSGSCIVCQEGLDTSGVYGMVALLQRSKHLRKLPLGNRRHILDLLRSPESLDVDVPRPEALRVRGVETSFHSAPQNPPGFAIRGFPASHVVPGMVVSSCGHLMHLRCFDSFYATIEARRGSMPTRNHPENVVRREFMCPFCKALGNALVPALPFVPSLGALLPLRFSPARPSAVWPRPQTAVDDSDTPCHDEDDEEDDEEDPYPHHFVPSHSRDPALATRLRIRHADAQFKASTDAAFGPLLGALADLRVSLSSLRPPAALDKRTRAEPHKIDPRPATRPGVASYSRPTPLSVRPGPDRPPALDVLTNLTAWRDVSATSGPGLRDALTHLIYNLGPAFNSTQLLTWDHVLNAVDFGPHTPPLEDLRVVPPLQPPLPLSPALLGLAGAQDPGSVEHAKVVFAAYQAARRAHEARRRMQLRLEAIAPHVAYTDDVKVVYYRLADVLRLHFHSQGATMTGQYFDRLLTDIFYYTVSVTEATLRGTRACQRTGTVLDSVSETTTALLHLLSQLILHLHNLTRTSAPRQPWLKRPARQRAALWLTKLLQPYLLYDAAALNSAPEAEAGSGPSTRSQPTYRPHDDGFRPPDPNMYTYLGLGYQAMDGAFREPDPNDDGAVVAIPEGLLSATATATAHALETSPYVYAQPLLLEDPFQALVEFSAFAVPEYGLNVLPYLLLFYAAEVTRAVLGLVEAAIRPDKPAWVTWAGAAALSGDATVEHIQAAYRTFDVFRPDLPPNLRQPPGSRSAESSAGLGRDSAQGSDAGDPETKATATDEDGTPLGDFAAWLMRKMACPTEAIAAFREQVPEAMLAKLVRSLTLPFLRKTVILLHTHFGMAFTDDYPHFVSPMTDEDHDVTPGTSADELWGQYAEFDRLVYLLNLPPLVELARLPSDGSPGVTSPRQHIYSFIAGWCQHLRATVPLVNAQLEEFALDEVAGAGPRATVRYTGPAAKRSSEPLPRSGPPLRVHIPPIPLISPAIMELTTLPTCFDYLFNGSNHVVCPRCEQVPTDPALCMFCGEFVCAQTACCEEDFYGECNLHMMACHGPIGIFLLVKNNAALLLSNDNGTFIVTPYRDYHGEMDLGLKRGRPLFLDQKRFDELRRLWLTQQVPNAVARSLENAFDTGGWITL